MKCALSIFASAVVCAAAFAVETFGIEGYLYTVPVHSNLIRGVVMGDSGDYGNVRYEDVEWLRNAFNERLLATTELIDPYVFATNELAINMNINPDYMNASIKRPNILPGVSFNNPSNVFSDVVRKIDTNCVPVAAEMVYSNVLVFVTNVVTSASSAYTNVYSVSSNIWYLANGATNRSPVYEDFCFTDYKREDWSFDNLKLLKEGINGNLINKTAVTNMFAWLRNSPNVSPVSMLNIEQSYWEKLSDEYSYYNEEIVLDYEVTPHNEETNRSDRVVITNALPAINVYSSRITDLRNEIRYVFDGSGHYERTEFWRRSTERKTSSKTDAGFLKLRISTPITTNAYYRLGESMPVKSVTCYALARITYQRNSSGSRTSIVHPPNYQVDVSTNVRDSVEVMIPIGSSGKVFVPETFRYDFKKNVCIELDVEDIQGKMDDAMRDFLSHHSVLADYNAYPPSLVNNDIGEMIPLHPNNPDDDSMYLTWRNSNYVFMECELIGIYGSFHYDFATKLETW